MPPLSPIYAPLYPSLLQGHEGPLKPSDVSQMLSTVSAVDDSQIHSVRRMVKLVGSNISDPEAKTAFQKIVHATEYNLPLDYPIIASKLAASPVLMKDMANRVGDSWCLRELAQTVRVDVAEVLAGHNKWHKDDPDIDWNSGSLLKAISIVSGAVGLFQLGGLPALGFVGGTTALIAGGQRFIKRDRIINEAKKGPLSFAQIKAFLGESPIPYPGLSADDTDVLSIIHQSSVRAGKPNRSVKNTAMLVRRFLQFADMTLEGLREDPQTQNHLLHAMAVATTHQLGIKTTVLNPHVLKHLKHLKEQGNKIIFMVNHRSYWDVLCVLLLLRDFGPRFVARKGLEKFMGALLTEGGHLLVNREQELVRALLELVRWGRDTLSEHCSPVIFFEGTRANTDAHGEIGLLPAEHGAAVLAAKAGFGTYVVPIMLAGTGHSLAKGETATLSHANVLISLGEPIEVVPYARKVETLSHNVWREGWKRLVAMQAALNNKLI